MFFSVEFRHILPIYISIHVVYLYNHIIETGSTLAFLRLNEKKYDGIITKRQVATLWRNYKDILRLSDNLRPAFHC